MNVPTEVCQTTPLYLHKLQQVWPINLDINEFLYGQEKKSFSPKGLRAAFRK